jgi:hypothetical protein
MNTSINLVLLNDQLNNFDLKENLSDVDEIDKCIINEINNGEKQCVKHSFLCSNSCEELPFISFEDYSPNERTINFVSKVFLLLLGPSAKKDDYDFAQINIKHVLKKFLF